MLKGKPLVSAVAAVVALLCLLGLAAPGAGQVPAMATISGTAYTFNTRNVIAGATIRAVEFPEVSTTTAEDGSYTLSFPVGSTVTLYIEAADHGSIRIQTFTLDDDHEGTRVEGANFQTPTTDVYAALRALITVYIGRDPFEDGCVIVTTVGMSELKGMPFEEFIQFAPHGVAGATATITPAVAEPIYFNSSVVPDIDQLTTSNDGGVLWPNVPPGRYVLSAQHPDVDFTTATVECAAGEVVNANPVWGLYAIDPDDTTPSIPATTTPSTRPEPSTTAPAATTPSSSVPSPSTPDSASTSTTAVRPTPSSTAPGGGAGSPSPTTAGTPSGAGVAGAGDGRSAGGALSRTGVDPTSSTVAAVALLIVGSTALVVGRHRRIS